MGKRMLGAILAFVLAFTLIPITGVKADLVTPQKFANLVFVVNFSDSSEDIFADGVTENGWTRKWMQGAETNITYYSYMRDYFEGSSKGETNFKDYMSLISDGKFEVHNYFPQESGNIINTVHLANPASYYANYNDLDLVQDVFSTYFGSVDTRTLTLSSGESLDFNGDGMIDNLTIVVQGPQSQFWSHKSILDRTDLMVNGVAVGTYNVISTDSLRADHGSVVAHEFIHSLGMPDLYVTSSGTDSTPVGPWDIMGAVQGSFMQYPLEYTRYMLGWVDAQTVTTSGTYTIDCATTTGGNRLLLLKTPKSETEFFAVEYRVKGSNINGYEYKIPSSGLVVYRINNNMSYKTNADGKNYIYVFRPNTAENPSAANEIYQNESNISMSEVYRAAVGGAGTIRSSLGSTDMTAPCTEDTIFYSDASNSGIEISNIVFSDDGKATFDITMPDYQNLDMWLPAGESQTGSGINGISMAQDGTNLYVAYESTKSDELNKEIYIKKWDGTNWTQVGAPINTGNGQDPYLTYQNGKLYLLYQPATNGKLKCTSLNTDGSWSDVATFPYEYANGLSKVSGSQELCYSFYVGNQFYIWNAITRSFVGTPITVTGGFAHPKACVFMGNYYVAYADYMDGRTGKLVKWTGSSWVDEKVFSEMRTMNQCELEVSNNQMYLVSSDGSGNPIYYAYDGSDWTTEVLPDFSGDMGLILRMDGSIPYLQISTGQDVQVYTKGENWSKVSTKVTGDASYTDMALMGSNIFVGTTTNNFMTVRYHSKENNSSEPIVETTDIKLNIPSGYSDNNLYIDGIPYVGTISSGVLTVDPKIKTGQVAILYKYNNSGIPIGMYVWKLVYNYGSYTATAVPELENLITYQGCSIRCVGENGLRLKSGINTATKQQLISASGLSGYKMTEAGTLVMYETDMLSLPFVKNGTYVGEGRAYYTEGGKTYDLVFEQKRGMDLFTSVVTKLAVRKYKSNICFRGYALVTYGDTQLIIYGPVVSRSLYTVASQVVSAGDFPAGSTADQYVRKIISDADSQ